MFPFTIGFSKSVPNINRVNDHFWSKVSEELKALKVTSLKARLQDVVFRNTFMSHGRSHLMAPVDNGVFAFDLNTKKLSYKLSMWRGFWFSAGFSILVYLLSSNLGYGLAAFLWLSGMNLITTYFRHRKFFNRIVSKLDCKGTDALV